MIWHVNSTPHRCIFGVRGITRFCKVVYWCFSMTGIVTTCHVAAQLQCFWESYPSFWKWDLVALLVGQRILLSHYFAVSQHPSWHVTGPLHFMICSRRRCHMLIHSEATLPGSLLHNFSLLYTLYNKLAAIRLWWPEQSYFSHGFL